jgi:hypothetical protein
MPAHVREGMDKDAKAVKNGGRVLAENNVAMYKEVPANIRNTIATLAIH